ncbi:uncharacterized protein CEXT_151061 [Caerostris extrusa]|uniref:Fibronectin type-III domain-containing protein n=1 Tax=Caerostris extrusa TaxID=172846 RepID=A0AAV4XT21_CAEEX|nr:uncharacterized protein CEXT_151061 [Caerostris extrusa]
MVHQISNPIIFSLDVYLKSLAWPVFQFSCVYRDAANKVNSVFGYYKDGKSNSVTNVTGKNGAKPTSKGLKYRSNMGTYRQSSEENETDGNENEVEDVILNNNSMHIYLKRTLFQYQETDNKEGMERTGRVFAFPQDEDAEQTVVLEEMCGLAPSNFKLAATKGYCVFLKWDPPKNEELAPFDFYLTEVENNEENQWKIYHASRNHITSMKLCGLEPGDHRFRMRTWTNNPCQYSEPSNVITLEEERGISKQHFF